jgi:hypothetical protein
VAVFLDEAGFTRWPDPAPDWDDTPPVADRRGANNGLWRLIGGLNALTGQVGVAACLPQGRPRASAQLGLTYSVENVLLSRWGFATDGGPQ